MKYVLFVAVLLTSFLLTSCSEQIEDHSLVSFQMEKSVKGNDDGNWFGNMAQYTQVPVKEWKQSPNGKGIEITFGCDMQEFDFVFAAIENSEKSQSSLIFLQKVNDTYILPIVLGYEIKDIRIFGVCNSTQEFGNYPFKYLQSFSHLGVENWEDGGSTIKVVASEWNSGNKDLFVEIYSETDRLLVYVGKPSSKEFEIPNFEIKEIKGINLFISYKLNELPIDRKK